MIIIYWRLIVLPHIIIGILGDTTIRLSSNTPLLFRVQDVIRDAGQCRNLHNHFIFESILVYNYGYKMKLSVLNGIKQDGISKN